MYLSNITVTVKSLPNGNYWYEAFSNSNQMAFGVISTFSFSVMTKTFIGTGIKLTGVSKVEYLG